jgi:hypothetical protein
MTSNCKPIEVMHDKRDTRPARSPIPDSEGVNGTDCNVAIFEEELMFFFRLFQFRSPNRDQETDNRRITLVQKALRSAVADAEAEIRGLRTRMAKARMSLTSLLGQIEDGDPEPALGAQLNNAEQRLLAGEQRLKQMKEHLARLREIEGAAAQLTNATIAETDRKAVA